MGRVDLDLANTQPAIEPNRRAGARVMGRRRRDLFDKGDALSVMDGERQHIMRGERSRIEGH